MIYSISQTSVFGNVRIVIEWGYQYPNPNPYHWKNMGSMSTGDSLACWCDVDIVAVV
jgi:hypothetical protein